MKKAFLIAKDVAFYWLPVMYISIIALLTAWAALMIWKIVGYYV